MGKRNGKISKPMEIVALRLTSEEKARLQEIADEHDVTLSWVMRQGLRLYAEDAAKKLQDIPHGRREQGLGT